MRLSGPVALAAITVLVSILHCAVAHAEVTTISQVKGADPKRDLKAAVAKGDTRFLAVNGFASGMVPGTAQYDADAALIAKHGKRTIRGTSDYKDPALNTLAHNYAETYNRMLIAHLRGKSR